MSVWVPVGPCPCAFALSTCTKLIFYFFLCCRQLSEANRDTLSLAANQPERRRGLQLTSSNLRHSVITHQYIQWRYRRGPWASLTLSAVLRAIASKYNTSVGEVKKTYCNFPIGTRPSRAQTDGHDPNDIIMLLQKASTFANQVAVRPFRKSFYGSSREPLTAKVRLVRRPVARTTGTKPFYAESTTRADAQQPDPGHNNYVERTDVADAAFSDDAHNSDSAASSSTEPCARVRRLRLAGFAAGAKSGPQRYARASRVALAQGLPTDGGEESDDGAESDSSSASSTSYDAASCAAVADTSASVGEPSYEHGVLRVAGAKRKGHAIAVVDSVGDGTDDRTPGPSVDLTATTNSPSPKKGRQVRSAWLASEGDRLLRC